MFFLAPLFRKFLALLYMLNIYDCQMYQVFSSTQKEPKKVFSRTQKHCVLQTKHLSLYIRELPHGHLGRSR